MPLSDLTKPQLLEGIRRTERRLGELDFALQDRFPRRVRTLKLAGGAAGTIAGFILAPPTGGLTLFIAGLGAILWADGFREDAQLDNAQRSARTEARRLKAYLAELDGELSTRA